MKEDLSKNGESFLLLKNSKKSTITIDGILKADDTK